LVGISQVVKSGQALAAAVWIVDGDEALVVVVD